MSVRNRPYMQLYVQDLLTDEKLLNCTAASQGVYFRLMCILHKQDQYGTFLLKQKYKQTSEQIINFANQLVPFLAFDFATVSAALKELVDEKVLTIDGDFLIQKRMVKDGKLSENRAAAGSKGGQKTQKKESNFAKANYQANTQANSEYEYEVEYEVDNDLGKGVQGENNGANPEADPSNFFSPTTDQVRFDILFKNAGIADGANPETQQFIFDQYCRKRRAINEPMTKNAHWELFSKWVNTWAQNERKEQKLKPVSGRDKLKQMMGA